MSVPLVSKGEILRNESEKESADGKEDHVHNEDS
jgi:hypothetical protein